MSAAQRLVGGQSDIGQSLFEQKVHFTPLLIQFLLPPDHITKRLGMANGCHELLSGAGIDREPGFLVRRSQGLVQCRGALPDMFEPVLQSTHLHQVIVQDQAVGGRRHGVQHITHLTSGRESRDG